MAPSNTCPYCRSPVESGEGSKECPSCGTAHHADCWEENGGCAVVGCSSGPKPTGESGVVLPPIEEPSPPSVVVDVGAEGKGEKRSRAVVVGAATAAVVAMAAVGVAFAVVLRDADRGDPVDPVEASGTSRTGGPVKAKAGPRDSSEIGKREAERGAERVLRRHHELLQRANGDPNDPDARRAFALLSARKRAAEENDPESAPGQSGFEFWISKRDYENLDIGQQVCFPGYAEIRSPGYWNPSTGEAMVYADFGSFAGFTWVLYENGRWTYDAGYGHVDSRSHWADESEILFQSTGVGC